MAFPKYAYKNNIYNIIDAQLKMKHPTTRKWVPAIMYHDINKPSKRYIREKSEFVKKFKLLEETNENSTNNIS